MKMVLDVEKYVFVAVIALMFIAGSINYAGAGEPLNFITGHSVEDITGAETFAPTKLDDSVAWHEYVCTDNGDGTLSCVSYDDIVSEFESTKSYWTKDGGDLSYNSVETSQVNVSNLNADRMVTSDRLEVDDYISSDKYLIGTEDITELFVNSAGDTITGDLTVQGKSELGETTADKGIFGESDNKLILGTYGGSGWMSNYPVLHVNKDLGEKELVLFGSTDSSGLGLRLLDSDLNFGSSETPTASIKNDGTAELSSLAVSGSASVGSLTVGGTSVPTKTKCPPKADYYALAPTDNNDERIIWASCTSGIGYVDINYPRIVDSADGSNLYKKFKEYAGKSDAERKEYYWGVRETATSYACYEICDLLGYKRATSECTGVWYTTSNYEDVLDYAYDEWNYKLGIKDVCATCRCYI